MGMKNASVIFQRTMEQILADIKGVLIYQDDVLVFGPNTEALEKCLAAVKTRLREKMSHSMPPSALNMRTK